MDFYKQMLVMYPTLKDDVDLYRSNPSEAETIQLYDNLLDISDIANYIDENDMTCSEFFDSLAAEVRATQ